MSNNINNSGSDWGFRMLKGAVIFNGVARSIDYVSGPISSLFSSRVVEAPSNIVQKVPEVVFSNGTCPVSSSLVQAGSPLGGITQIVASNATFPPIGVSEAALIAKNSTEMVASNGSSLVSVVTQAAPIVGSEIVASNATFSASVVSQAALIAENSTEMVASNRSSLVSVVTQAASIVGSEIVASNQNSLAVIPQSIQSIAYPLFQTGTSTMFKDSMPKMVPEMCQMVAPVIANTTLSTPSLMPLMCVAKPVISPALLAAGGGVAVVASLALAHRLYHRKAVPPIKKPVRSEAVKKTSPEPEKEVRNSNNNNNNNNNNSRNSTKKKKKKKGQ